MNYCWLNLSELTDKQRNKLYDSWALWKVVAWVPISVNRLIKWTVDVHHKHNKPLEHTFVIEWWIDSDTANDYHPLNRKDIEDLLIIAWSTIKRKSLPYRDWKYYHIVNSVQTRLIQWIPLSLRNHPY